MKCIILPLPSLFPLSLPLSFHKFPLLTFSSSLPPSGSTHTAACSFPYYYTALGDVTVIDEGCMEGRVERTGAYGILPSNYVEKQ